jgi:tetratricopeptide (TPR) repeat protein
MSAGAKSRRYRAAAGGRLSAKYRRYLALVAAAVLVAGSTITAMAETIDREPLKPIGPPAALPKIQHGEQTQNLDRLFEALKVAPDDDSAKYVKVAIDNKDYDLAIKLLNAIIDIKPDFVEAWNRRATVYYTKKDFGRALADLHEVLARGARPSGARAGPGDKPAALGAPHHHPAGARRRQARARGVPARACDPPSPRAHPRVGPQAVR